MVSGSVNHVFSDPASPLDHTIPFACAEHLASHLGGPVERMNLVRSYHVISIDVEREELAARVGEFFDRRLALPVSTTTLGRGTA